MTVSLDGRVAVVTGAGAGIGRGTATLLAERGAKVVAADIDGGRADATVTAIRESGGDAVAVTADVADEQAVEALMSTAVNAFGRLDILHNNAAITSAGHVMLDTDVARMSVDIWDRTMAVNLRGTMLGCKHAVPHMLRAGGGSIINTSSSSAFRGDMGRTAYGTSKAAIIALTTYVAAQYGRDRVRCNVIVPRASSPEARPPSMPPEVVAHMAQLGLNLLGRTGTPADIGQVVAFLASDEASWITGSVLHVDGGSHALQPWWSVSREVYEQEIRGGADAT
jgi:NAD(P)-dependent dehydrogenase (short-subunit alcohol dehydrogenase family)